MKRFTKLTISQFALVIVTLFILASSNEAQATHFRSGHLTYVKNPLNNKEVTFTFTMGFRASFYNWPAIGSVFTANDVYLRFGDFSNTTTPGLYFKVIAVDFDNDWVMARALQPGDYSKQSITFLYDTQWEPGPFIAEFFQCCRPSYIVNNRDENFRISTIVDVTNGNNSPVSTLPNNLTLYPGPSSSFFVPALDIDSNTTLRWRFATLEEMGGVTQNPPVNPSTNLPAVINPLTGLVTWDTFNWTSTAKYFSCQVIIEDRNALDTTIVRTKVAVDYLIKIPIGYYNPSGAPSFNAPTPTSGSTIYATVGVPITFTVNASDAGMGNIAINALGLPQGASMNPQLPAQGNPVSSNFSWTPSVQQLGPHIVSFTATDEVEAQTICNISFVVVHPTSLNLTVIPEGFYNDVTGSMVSDTARVYLRNSNSPYSIIDSARSVLDMNGNGNFNFTFPNSGQPLYIVVKHRNSLETWSNPVSLSSSFSYNFTTSANKAYGNNLVLKGSKYCIYSGDVYKDGTIDASDLSMIANDAAGFVSGYQVTDLTGDNFVDGSDFAIADNNAANYVSVIRP